MKNKKIIFLVKIALFIVVFNAYTKESGNNNVGELFVQYNQQVNLFRQKFIELIKTQEPSLDININQIIIIPNIVVIDTVEYYKCKQETFFKSICIDSSYNFQAYIHISNQYYHYCIYNGSLLHISTISSTNENRVLKCILDNDIKYCVSIHTPRIYLFELWYFYKDNIYLMPYYYQTYYPSAEELKNMDIYQYERSTKESTQELLENDRY